jgi:peptidoglycan-associated lipoprotein
MIVSYARTLATPFVLAIAIAFATGCASSKKVNDEIRLDKGTASGMGDANSGTNAAQGRVSGPGVAPRDSVGSIGGTTTQVSPGSDTKDQWIEEGPEALSDPNLTPVYFGFDADELDAQAKATIAKNAKYLLANPKLGLVLRGHTDTRGTPEYNLALGSRRAQAVKDALTAAGVSAIHVETVSFGEEVPVAGTDDESENPRNRRVEFFVYVIQ